MTHRAMLTYHIRGNKIQYVTTHKSLQELLQLVAEYMLSGDYRAYKEHVRIDLDMIDEEKVYG